MSVHQSDLNDPALVGEVDLARAAAQEEAGDERVGAYVEYQVEDSAAVTHLFEADKPGYQGWRWAVTVTSAGPDTDVTVSEVVLLPGPTALVAPDWIPWQKRVQAGDLGVGDLLPTAPDDPRLVPAYLQSDDPAVEEAAAEAGLGRVRVMSRPARLDAADRWQQSEFGPRSDMARSAPAHCGTCGFYLPLAGSLRAAFGTCGNEMSPADGHVVHAEYGCGAHSEAEVEQVSPVLVADLIYDDAQLDVEPLGVVDEVPEAGSAEPGDAEGTAPAAGPVESEAVQVVPDEAEPVEAVAEAPEPEIAGGSADGADVPEAESVGAETAGGSVEVSAGAPEADHAAVSDGSAESEEPEVVAGSAMPESVASEEPDAGSAGAEVAGGSAEVPEAAPDVPGDSAESEVVEPETAGSGASESVAPGVGSAGVDVSDGSADVEVSGVEPEVAAGSGTSESVASEEADSAGSVVVPAEDESSAVAPEEPAESSAGDASGVAEAETGTVGLSATTEGAAPAGIEPVVTGETSGNDESAPRE